MSGDERLGNYETGNVLSMWPNLVPAKAGSCECLGLSTKVGAGVWRTRMSQDEEMDEDGDYKLLTEPPDGRLPAS